MKKLTLIISLILVSAFFAGCGKSPEDTKVEPRKNIMGHGNEKVDGSPTKNGGI